MKRIGNFFGKLVVVVAGLAVIAALTGSAVNGARDLIQRLNLSRFHDEQRVVFPGTATAMVEINAKLIYDKTHSPAPTVTPTETDDNSTGQETQVGELPDTELVPPTDLPTVVPTTAPSSTPTYPLVPTETFTSTATPTDAATTTPTETLTSTPTNTPPPTIVAIVPTIPPTNTKRAATATATATLSASSTIPPTLTSAATATSVPSPTQTATQMATQAATQVVTEALGPTLAATSKLPTVVAFSECTNKPQSTAVPTRAPRVQAHGYDIMNILLIGSDKDVDPTDPSERTDTLVVVSINRTTNSVSMLSIPRDMYVCIPDFGMQRINTAFTWGQAVGFRPSGGFGALQATILYNFGIPIHYYAKLSLNAFKQIVETLKGIDVAVDCPISDLRFQGQYNDQQTPIYSPFKLDPGYYHMDGSMALWYARMRHSTSDFDRNRRQQQVLRAIWRTARDEGLISKAPELWSQVTSIVETNMQLTDALGLVPLALSLKPGDIRSFYMQKGIETMHWRTPQGDDVQVPDPKGFFRTINDFYTPPTGNRLSQDVGAIEVLNGTPNNHWDKVAAERLAWEGFETVAKGGTEPANKTVIYDFTGSAKPGVINIMLKALNLRSDRVISQPDPNRTADFRVVLGKDYNSCSVPGFDQ